MSRPKWKISVRCFSNRVAAEGSGRQWFKDSSGCSATILTRWTSSKTCAQLSRVLLNFFYLKIRFWKFRLQALQVRLWRTRIGGFRAQRVNRFSADSHHYCFRLLLCPIGVVSIDLSMIFWLVTATCPGLEDPTLSAPRRGGVFRF